MWKKGGELINASKHSRDRVQKDSKRLKNGYQKDSRHFYHTYHSYPNPTMCLSDKYQMPLVFQHEILDLQAGQFDTHGS